MSARPRTSRSRWLRRTIIAGGVAVLGLPVMAGVASAHIAVSTPDAVRGGEVAQLAFRVPDESATASTIKVRIDLPPDAPVAEVKARSLPGWRVTVSERKLPAPTKVGDFTLTSVPASVTWTASAGAGIAPGEFEVFEILISPVPDAPTMAFVAVQTYSDGSVVTWDQPEAADGTEAEFPAPMLELVASGEPASQSPSASGSASATPSVTVSTSPVAPAEDGAGSGSDPFARVLAALAVALGAAALVVVLVRRRA